MIVWLIPVALYWLLAPLYLGGTPIRIEGGSGPRELLGLLVSKALFLVCWGVVRMVGVAALGEVGGIVAASLVAILLIPPMFRVAFRLAGVRLGKAHLWSAGGTAQP